MMYFDTKLTTPQDEKNMKNILNFVLDSKPTRDHTTHWWYHQLKNKVKISFDELANAYKSLKCFNDIIRQVFMMLKY